MHLSDLDQHVEAVERDPRLAPYMTEALTQPSYLDGRAHATPSPRPPMWTSGPFSVINDTAPHLTGRAPSVGGAQACVVGWTGAY